MFSGIVAAVGEVSQVNSLAGGAHVVISSGLDLSDVKQGDSIAVNGVCLTVTGLGRGAFKADVSRETLNCTSGFAQKDKVNLEKALRLSDRVNGHLVSGHVDGVGKVAKFERTGECYLLAVKAPRGLAKYISRKGSIAVNGVSLTVNKVEGGEFSVNLIPHTLASTNLRYLKRGAKVNLEADMLARYAEQLLMTKRK
ncbi:MAG TPA: riboflavin synthase [Burkholderiales bacterium]|nr:riboflavin synthase [Burkholderiales bacterium]